MHAWQSLMVSRAGFALALMLFASSARGFVAFEAHRNDDGVPEAANGALNSQPSIRAHYLNGDAIELDGRLDDAAWQSAMAGGGFRQAEPNRFEAPSEQTVFKVAYDENALYFAVACFENDVAQVASSLSRRDRIDNSDVISIYIDPYHDRTTGYNFRVNMDGVQMDQYVFNDGNTDRDWDAVWQAETYRDDRGWFAEFRIPFSAIRYRPDDEMTWGLQVYRWMHGRGEDIGWAVWDRDTRGFVSRFGTLTGLSGVPAPRQLEVMPYFAARSTDPVIGPGEVDEFDNFQNFGADLKYGVTADLTLNATFQPDFGQVEADPATLNLSPFETFFDEKRPFFIEGARFFEHPNFNLVYTRRIGTGDENSRIRAASKLTGKVAGDISTAVMFAATDLTGDGQAHNFLKSGDEQSYFAVARFGKEFADGNHRVNAMQTGVWRTNTDRFENHGSRRGRDGFSSGLDGEMNFRDRTYRAAGSFVYTMVDPIAPIYSEDNDDGGTPGTLVPGVNHAPKHGTGGNLQLQRLSGRYRGGIFGRWEHDKLDPNDMGRLGAPDDINASLWLQRRFNRAEDSDGYLLQGNVNFNFWRGWFYGAQTNDVTGVSGTRTGSYGRGKPQYAGFNINGWMENKHRWSMHYGFDHNWSGRSRFATRGGPVMENPGEIGAWMGGNSDWRKALRFNTNFSFGTEYDAEEDVTPFRNFKPEQGYWFNWSAGMNWVQSSRLNHSLDFFFRRTREDDQWVGNFDNPGGGIGDTSYVFGRLDQRIFEFTLRSNVLFNRSQSLELYVQPFVTVGNFYEPRELSEPDSYLLTPYTDPDTGNLYEIRENDFQFASANLNAVYRWEWRPGSTLFLVWTHARSSYRDRSAADSFEAFANDLDGSSLFKNEPENTFLVKLSYWLPI